jgi:hypothetical protein
VRAGRCADYSGVAADVGLDELVAHGGVVAVEAVDGAAKFVS